MNYQQGNRFLELFERFVVVLEELGEGNEVIMNRPTKDVSELYDLVENNKVCEECHYVRRCEDKPESDCTALKKLKEVLKIE